MGSVRMFRDRVVSMEQTQEIGEKYIELLTVLAIEALPGHVLEAHGLEHERDHYWLSFANETTGEKCRVAFTRMFLSDASRLPAVAADADAPIRGQIVSCIRAQAGRADILVGVADLLTQEERIERDEIEAEWQKKNELALAAKRAEEERRSRERQRQKQQEDARRKAQRERERRERPAAASSAQQPGEGGGRRRRRRGRAGAPGQPGGGRPQAAQAAGPAPGPRPQAQPPRPPQAGSMSSPEGARAEGGGRRRRRRGRGRGAGGPRPGGAPPASSGGSS